MPNPFFQVISEAKFDENFKKQVAYEEEGSVCMQSAYYTRRNKREEKILKVQTNVVGVHFCLQDEMLYTDYCTLSIEFLVRMQFSIVNKTK